MDLLHLVDRLEELVASAQKMPIGSRAIIDRRRLLDIADQMRIAVPQEVREAQEMVAERERLQREAEEEAQMIVAHAEQEAARLVQESQITAAARARAQEIASQAEARLQERIAEANNDIQARLVESRGLAEQQMNAADRYARDLLKRLERQLQAFVGSVEAGIAQLESTAEDTGPDEGGEQHEAGDVEREVAAALAVPLHPASAELPSDAPEYPAPLENLLQREPPEAAAEQPAAPGVIDDLEMPRLDDDPVRIHDAAAADARRGDG